MQTVSALAGTIGAALIVAGRRDPGSETIVLGAGAAASFGLVDVVYVVSGRISPVYLVDAAVQLPLAVAWLLTRRRTQAQD